MTQKDAARDPTLRALAAAIRADPRDRVADLAFDDRCEELGVRIGSRFSRALFMICCTPDPQTAQES